jgi:hypothetical protein
MEAQRPQFAVRLLPSLADFAFLMPIVFLFGRMDGVKTLLSDADTGWHIRTGEWILAHRGVPTHDMFSFSRPGETWYAWEWLSEVVLAGLHSAGGLAAVLLADVAILSVVFALLYGLVRRKANPVVAIVVTFVAAVCSSVHWLARPHLFTLLFVVLFYRVLERVREGRARVWGVPWIALLPAATILWTNLHAGFFIGILIVGAYGAGEALRAALGIEAQERRAAARNAARYFAVAAGCLAASLVNPYTWRLHAHVVEYLRNPYQSQHIAEFLTLSFHHPIGIFLEIMLLASALACFRCASRKSFTEPVLLLMWAHAALLAGRNIPIFMILAAPPVGAAVEHGLARLAELNVAGWLRRAAAALNALAARTAETEAIPRWHLASAAGVLVVAALLYAPAPPPKFRAEYDPKTYPAAAVEVLRREGGARIFTNDLWGGYLIYRLYPRTRVFVDPRSDFYGLDFSEQYMSVLNVKYDWEQTLDRFGVNTILLPPSAPLAGALKESARWRVVYDDGVAVVFRPPQAVGKTLSATVSGGGTGRDREITKTEARDRAITELKPKT